MCSIQQFGDVDDDVYQNLSTNKMLLKSLGHGLELYLKHETYATCESKQAQDLTVSDNIKKSKEYYGFDLLTQNINDETRWEGEMRQERDKPKVSV